MANPGAKHDRIALPGDIFAGSRPNSAGLDLSDENTLARVSESLQTSASLDWMAAPDIVGLPPSGPARTVVNPADHDDVVGTVSEATEEEAAIAAARAAAAVDGWSGVPPGERGSGVGKAAELM